MREKILSIIIPVYNREQYLRQCLDSVCIESLSDEIEVLAIDDGSMDGSGQIVDEYAVRYPGMVKAFHHENCGVGSVINFGMTVCTGKYVREVDADDYVDSGVLARMVSFLKNTNVDLVITQHDVIDERDNKRIPILIYGVFYETIYKIESILKRVSISIQNITWKRTLFNDNKNGIAKERLYIDMELVPLCIMHAITCMILPDSLYRYRVGLNDQSVSISSYIRNIHSFSNETFLSISRYRSANEGNYSNEIIDYLRLQAINYLTYLYGITALNENESLLELDDRIREENKELYEQLNACEFIYRFRNEGWKDEKRYKIEVEEAFRKKVEQNGGNNNIAIFTNLFSETKRDIDSEAFRWKKKFDLFHQWFLNQEQEIEISRYFIKNHYKRIGIYGFAEFGCHLLHQLMGCNDVEVVCIVDKNKDTIIATETKGINLYHPKDRLPKIDIMVVTAIYAFDKIYQDLKGIINCPIISLEEVIYRP